MVGEHMFTESHMRVISLAVHGLQRKEMADVLGLSEATIGSYLDRISKELRLSGITRIAVFALKNGFDEEGRYKGEYLFDNYTELPWEKKSK